MLIAAAIGGAIYVLFLNNNKNAAQGVEQLTMDSKAMREKGVSKRKRSNSDADDKATKEKEAAEEAAYEQTKQKQNDMEYDINDPTPEM